MEQSFWVSLSYFNYCPKNSIIIHLLFPMGFEHFYMLCFYPSIKYEEDTHRLEAGVSKALEVSNDIDIFAIRSWTELIQGLFKLDDPFTWFGVCLTNCN